jgi:hypothetical protein
MKKVIITFIAALIACGCGIFQKQAQNNNPMKQTPIPFDGFEYITIIAETDRNVNYLTSIAKIDYNNAVSFQEHAIGKDDFFIRFSIFEQSKTENIGGWKIYDMHVIPDNDGYKTKLCLTEDTLYKDGVVWDGFNIDLTYEWKDGGKLGAAVLHYCLTHQKIKSP